MKKLFTLLLCLSLVSLIYSQDKVKLVKAELEDGSPNINALIKDVAADTSATGEQLHDVYKLERGKYYFYNETPVFKNAITLVADAPGNDDATKPPKIIVTQNEEGETPEAYIISTFADLTLKNIAFSTQSIDGEYTWANVLVLNKDSLKLDIEGCIFELSGWGMLECVNDDLDIRIKNSVVRNGTVYDYGNEWCPFFLEINTGSCTILEMTNNTFFNIQGSIINIEMQGFIDNFIFDHNTCVNIVKGFSSAINAHLNSTITNNIFYNVGAHGQTKLEVSTQEDLMINSVIAIDTLYGNSRDTIIAGTVDESDRKLLLSNNAYFFSDDVKAYWASYDSVLATPWLDDRSLAIFADTDTYSNVIEENNVEVDPVFANFGGTEGMVSQMISHRDSGNFGFWGWDPDSALYSTEEWKVQHWAFLQWPLPEDFSYSASLTSTDGYHVGSLQYYPSELNQYTDVEEVTEFPTEFSLSQNYPNPFNPSTVIEYQIPEEGKVSLKIYDVLGQEVKTVVNSNNLPAGTYTYRVDMADYTSGVYFYTLSYDGNVQTKKMLLVK